MVEEKHITVCKNINTYLSRLIERLETDEVDQLDLVDILGSLDTLSKAAKKFVDSAKKGLEFKGSSELKGSVYKVKKSLTQNVRFDPAEVREELDEKDFMRVISVTAKKLDTFLTKDVIDNLKKPAGETERFHFESI